MKRALLRLLVLASLSVGLMSVPLGATVSAINVDNAKEQVCRGAGAGSDCDPGGTSLEDAIAVVINILSLLVGVVAVIMLIYGGFKYVTAAGDSSNLATAKHTIIYAIVGLVIVALAQFFVFFVLEQIAGGG